MLVPGSDSDGTLLCGFAGGFSIVIFHLGDKPRHHFVQKLSRSTIEGNNHARHTLFVSRGLCLAPPENTTSRSRQWTRVSSRPTRSLTLAGRRPPRNPILDPLSSSPRAPGKVPAEPGRRPRLLQPSLARFGKHGCRIGAPAVLLVEVQLGRRLVINNTVISHDVRTAEPFHAHHQFCPGIGMRRRRGRLHRVVMHRRCTAARRPYQDCDQAEGCRALGYDSMSRFA
jgi:hypothetical protein